MGRAVGIGPLAGVVPPDQVTDPGEMIARSLQATLDAASVHVAGTLEGRLPGALLERDEAVVNLAGTTLTADLRPRDARTSARISAFSLGVDLETITVWTTAWYRSGGGPWQQAPVSEATSDTGVDINPLTLVDRLRSYLASSGRTPTTTDVTCGSASGRCHEVRLEAGTDPAGILTGMLPGASGATVPPVSTVVTLRTDALTLRPTSLSLIAASEDGTIDLRLALRFWGWDAPVRIDEPPVSPE
ncbi:MAG: hypothetical protein MUQ32_06990 [Chloroflexi bacterium]|nr:hypothetical protein [Chloroflexota bacterium]